MKRILIADGPGAEAWQARLRDVGWVVERFPAEQLSAMAGGGWDAAVVDPASAFAAQALSAAGVSLVLLVGAEAADPTTRRACDRALEGRPGPANLLLALHRALVPQAPPGTDPEALFEQRAAWAKEGFGEGLAARLEVIEAALRATPPDWTQARARVHALAGTAGTLGWPETSRLARVLEQALAEGKSPTRAWAALRRGVDAERATHAKVR